MMHPSQAVGAQNYSQWSLEQLAAFVVVGGGVPLQSGVQSWTFGRFSERVGFGDRELGPSCKLQKNVPSISSSSTCSKKQLETRALTR